MEYQITDGEFQQFSALVYEKSGIALSKIKKTLVLSRLTKRLRVLGLETFQDYYDYVTEEVNQDESCHMMDLITTNKTDFFREPTHFKFLRKQVLPKLQILKKARIWSAGCSSGEEPYSIAMTLFDSVVSPAQWDYKILASDISTRVMDRASGGIHDVKHAQGLSPEVIRRHFIRKWGGDASKIKVKPHLSQMIIFRQVNLMDDSYSIRSQPDVIFCRNVMIYFNRSTQEQLINKFYRYLKPGGYLFIGHSESLQWAKHTYRHVRPTIYQKAV